MSEAQVPFFKPSFGLEELAAVGRVLDSGWLTTGPVARRLEEAFARYTGADHVVALNSCTSALFLSLRASFGGRRFKAAVPAWTFLSTAQAVENAGGECVFVDSEPESLNLDPESLRRVCAEHRPEAILPVHFNGNPAPMTEIGGIADLYGVEVIVEDCAHAAGSTLNGRHVGTFGTAGCFSLYTTKNFTSGEGGLLVTRDAALADRVRTMSACGQARAAIDRLRQGEWHKPEASDEGWKANLPDVLAAIAEVQLSRLPGFMRTRQALANVYDRRIEEVNAELGYQAYRPLTRSAGACPHMYIVRVDRKLDREQVARRLTQDGIQVQVHYKPVPFHRYWRDRAGVSAAELPVCREAQDRVLSLPFWVGLNEASMETVVAALRKAAGVVIA